MISAVITLNASLRIVVGEAPPRAERIPEDPRIGLVHTFSGLSVRTIVFVPADLAYLATDE